jgi:hypothetical protein
MNNLEASPVLVGGVPSDRHSWHIKGAESMKNLNLLPPVLLVRFAYFWLCGRVHFPKKRLEVAKGHEDFVVFRQAVLELKRSQPKKGGAILKVRFQFRRFSLKTNRMLSIIPIPFILAQPGFQSKTWMLKKRTGEFQGLYEWDTVAYAEKYLFSFPMKLMKKRAVPESLTFEIIELE